MYAVTHAHTVSHLSPHNVLISPATLFEFPLTLEGRREETDGRLAKISSGISSIVRLLEESYRSIGRDIEIGPIVEAPKELCPALPIGSDETVEHIDTKSSGTSSHPNASSVAKNTTTWETETQNPVTARVWFVIQTNLLQNAIVGDKQTHNPN